MVISPSIIKEIESLATKMGCGMPDYWNYHRHRFYFEVELLSRYFADLPAGKKLRLLDIGPAFQTVLFSRLWKDRLHIDTFGFRDSKFPPPDGGRHFDFDLNDAYFPDRWPRIEPYDIVVMFEVIEHLYTSPVQVFRLLKSLVIDNGIIIISTPNAVTLPRRIKMLFGKHPFEHIRETRENPGHYREVTRLELCEMGEAAGLEVVETFALNLAGTGSFSSQLFKAVSKILPRDLRKELIVVFRNRVQ
jgi:Methyltransferase domain